MFRNIVVAIDGSPTSMHGFKEAVALALDQHAKLHVVHVVDSYPTLTAYEGAGYVTQEYTEELAAALLREADKLLARAEAAAAKQGVAIRRVVVEARGSPVADAVLAQARKLKADLIVLGTHGRRGLRRLVLGSDAEAIVRGAPVPVLLVRRGTRIGEHAVGVRAPRQKARLEEADALV